MSFPLAGHSVLGTAGWTWDKPPGSAPAQSGFNTVHAVITIRRPTGTAMPAIFEEGHKLASGDFGGDNAVPVPEGDFYLQCPSLIESRHDHEVYELTWVGFKEDQGLDTAAIFLTFPAFSNGTVAVESCAPKMGRRNVSLPEGEEIYAGAGLLAGHPVNNPQTEEKQRVELLIKTYSRAYTGKAVVVAPAFMPEPTCNFTNPDTDGGINLAGAGAAEVRIRKIYWWPGKTTNYTWLLTDFQHEVLSTHGNVMLLQWSAQFDLTKQEDF